MTWWKPTCGRRHAAAFAPVKRACMWRRHNAAWTAATHRWPRGPGARSSNLTRVAEHAIAHGGSLALVTAATEIPDEYLAAYEPAFAELGVKRVQRVDARTRQDAYAAEVIDGLSRVAAVFFT